MMKEKIPLSEAALRLKCTPQNVLMHIKRELLSGEVIKGSWFVDGASLEDFLARQGDSPRQKLCPGSCSRDCSSCGEG